MALDLQEAERDKTKHPGNFEAAHEFKVRENMLPYMLRARATMGVHDVA
jgi:hypothetical protein